MGDADDPDLTELSPASDTPTRSDRAWALDDGADEVTTHVASWRRAAAVACAIVVGAAVVIGGLTVWHLRDRPAEVGSPPAPPTMSAEVPASVPEDPADQTFVRELRDRGVEVSDLAWYAENGRILCRVAVNKNASPGSRTFEIAREVVRGEDPTWDSAKVSNYTAAVFNAYCPHMWGPSAAVISKMPPDERYVALFMDRTGGTSDDYPGNIQAARNQCRALSEGTSRAWLLQEMVDSGIEEDLSDRILRVGIEVYCPEFA